MSLWAAFLLGSFLLGTALSAWALIDPETGETPRWWPLQGLLWWVFALRYLWLYLFAPRSEEA